MSISRLSQIVFSEGVRPGLIAFVDSHKSTLTHSCHSLAIFAISAGLSIAGVKSILKSHVNTINHFGECIASHIVSGIL